MRKKTWRYLMTGLVLCLLCLVSGCSGKKGGDEKKVVVGSKSFTESNLLAEIYSLALEANGFTVERKLNIAGSVIHAAITSDEIDLYPEYTGTALLSILKGPLMTDRQEVYDYLVKEFKEKYHLDLLTPSTLNDGQGLVIRTEAAEQYGIRTISDLQKHASKLRFASQGDFDEREDGIPALEAAYGPLSFQSSTVYDESLKYDVLRNNQADVAVAYTTDGMLADEAFTLLTDDKNVWPPYEAVPVVRESVLAAYPEIRRILDAVSENLTTEAAMKLNARVDIDKEEMEEVALDFFNGIKDKAVIHP